ncbi:swi5-dependent recombination DNA repair protein 1 homolog isoform X4 [Apis dorsata]|uniref:swi5-dependent recombination DNA repair protein 1 homolog isoform X2 n=1 Tax=Apis dorsata TaxID=7462 RepID=UPI001293ABE2|nr:swi5-dependent recombination DNA repair protein 1 homolog isoform X2 [Apis dorsata]XP_031370867.1 swi5-dependent recombination DNA repair protein 1 homolog isoform X3 [Apis dorsata]XP_031370868.1 swi5-dependent recombination DNA repair protein 1 homolog isoform X4 [Apis dorsata]
MSMNAKPFKNGKGVNKPFRSPFSTPQSSDNINISKLTTYETPLKVSIAKRLIYQKTPSPKKLCINKENNNKQTDIKIKNKLYQIDLELLKKKIQEKEESIKILKTTLLYKKKNKAENLESVIKKWTTCCQNALIDYQKCLQEKNDQPVKLSEILSLFNINPDIVCFSIDDDTFY